jgi:hypothetical protein
MDSLPQLARKAVILALPVGCQSVTIARKQPTYRFDANSLLQRCYHGDFPPEAISGWMQESVRNLLEKGHRSR